MELSEDQNKALYLYGKQLDNILVRHWLRNTLSNYNDKVTYVIFDGKKIEIYNKEIFEIKQELKQFSSYFISKPVLMR